MLLDRSGWWPTKLRQLRSYLLAPSFAAGLVFADTLLTPMIADLNAGMPAVIEALLSQRADMPSLSLQPLPKELRDAWNSDYPPRYEHLVRACLVRHWTPLGLLRMRQGWLHSQDCDGCDEHAHTNNTTMANKRTFIIANPSKELPVQLTDRVYVIRKQTEYLARRDGDSAMQESKLGVRLGQD